MAEGRIKLIKSRIKDVEFLDGFRNVFLILAATDDKVLNSW